MAYTKSTTLTGLNDLFTLISDALVASGATRTVINSSSGAPSVDRVKREDFFVFNGTAAKPTRLGALVTRANTSNWGDYINLMVFTGWKGLKNVTSCSRMGTTVTVTCTAHGFATGDVVIINGTDNDNLNELWSGGALASPPLITVVDADTFTYESPNAGSVGNTTSMGGKAIAIYNHAGTRHAGFVSSTGAPIRIDDSPMSAYLWHDEFGMLGVVAQGALRRVFFIGQCSRSHIPSKMGDAGFSTGSVTGDGTNKVITIDRNTANILALRQSVTLYSPSDGTVDFVPVSARPANNQITLPVSAGKTFPTGSLIGWDAMPGVVMGNENTSVTDLNQMVAYFTHYDNGSRSDAISQTAVPRVDVGQATGTSNEQWADPNPSNAYGMWPLSFWNQTGATGWRGKIPGGYAVAFGTQSDLERGFVGDTDPDDYFVVFTTIQCDASGGGGPVLLLGPGATA